MGNIIADVGNNNDAFSAIPLSFFKTNNKNIYTYAVKLSDKGDGVVLRLMNLSDKEQKVSLETDLSFSSYVEVNGMEENLFEQANFEKELVFKSYELKSLILKTIK
ncbi:MAG TPA: hypothetical protein DDW90_11325 [Cyanobacteria bacterium UBA9971]|nr:hypothetical protein [Cyanobacteria bacterium UBA9971]